MGPHPARPIPMDFPKVPTEGDGGAPGRLSDRQGSPLGQGRNWAEKTYHDLEDEDGISLPTRPGNLTIGKP